MSWKSLSRLLVFVGMVFLVAFRAVAAPASSSSNVVQMAPMKVREAKGQFDFDVRSDERTMLVQEMKISWVSDWAYKQGLRIGDRLVAIDGKPVGDYLVETIATIMKRQLKEGESLRLQFTGTRFGLPRKITLTSRG